MIQAQLKLKLTKRQEGDLDRWLYHLTSVWNWAIRKIELNVKDGIYFPEKDFRNLLAGHSRKLDIPGHVLQGTLTTAHVAWRRCFKKLAGKPRLKGARNKLTSIPFPDPPLGVTGSRIRLRGWDESLRFHKQAIPEGKLKSARIVKRASGWYCCLTIDGQPNAIPRLAVGMVGIDPGFGNLLTLSSGEIIDHPRELEASAQRLAQAQRGRSRQLTARIQERIGNQRRDRNHKLSRKLIAENTFIAWSKDRHSAISKRFGKSVASSGHDQLRQMLAYKSPTSGTRFVEVDCKGSTMTCNECGCQSGPTGLAGLLVRQWRCPCGAEHDRDVNAAINTLLAGAGIAHEVIHV